MKKILCVLMCIVLALLLTACGCVNEEQAILPTDATQQLTEKRVKVYFPDENVLYMEAEERIVKGESDVDIAEAIINEILKGPESDGLNPAVRGEVQMLSIAIDENGLCTVNLSEEFETYNTGGSAMESMAIYSVVNSLCELESIARVKINIEGKEDIEYGGHFYLGEPLEPDADLICSYPLAE